MVLSWRPTKKVTSFAHMVQMPIIEKLEDIQSDDMVACCADVLMTLAEKKAILAEKKLQWQAAYEQTNRDVVNLWEKE